MEAQKENKNNLIEQAASQWFDIVFAHINAKKNPELLPAILANKNKDKAYVKTNN